jgi:aminopeptidase N
LCAALLASFWMAASATAGVESDAGSAVSAATPRPADAAMATRTAIGADPYSYAEPSQSIVRHATLDLDVDFATQRLTGAVELRVERVVPMASRLRLDTRGLEIRAVAVRAANGALVPLEYALGSPDPLLGRSLEIRLPAPAASSDPLIVRVEYSTGPDATALQWLAPEQTAGRLKPFLYTQSQSIHARSWIPIQDSPAIRMTYEARIRTPPGLRAVMSAARDPRSPPGGEQRFVMAQPIPAYLIALAVGELEFRSIGPRTGIYAEPERLVAASHEFADLEAMLATAERLFGPYRWERYDLLIMPPSFPFGGMENPRLSFITPTVIAGDRSLVSMITHELSHSWSGNLVTNARWDDFWLNEGFTTYLERRVLEGVFGTELAAMELVLGRQYLAEGVAELVADGRTTDTTLALDLRGRSPDEATGDIAYEKGSLFLQFLEQRCGRAALDEFLVGYFRDFAFRSLTTRDFETYLHEHLLRRRPGAVSDAELAAWLHGTGVPASAPPAPAAAFAVIERQRDAWLARHVATDGLGAQDWRPQEWMRFLDTLPSDLPDARLAELDARWRLGQATNYEIARSWLLLAVRNDYAPAEPQLTAFLVGTGRHKMVNQLYTELARTPERCAVGLRVYARARPGYHPITQTMVDRLLKDCPRP